MPCDVLSLFCKVSLGRFKKLFLMNVGTLYKGNADGHLSDIDPISISGYWFSLLDSWPIIIIWIYSMIPLLKKKQNTVYTQTQNTYIYTGIYAYIV